jgi:hypothetical protein
MAPAHSSGAASASVKAEGIEYAKLSWTVMYSA